MRKFIILISFLVITIATAKCQENVIKKCKTCGKPIKECSYYGNHPKVYPTKTSEHKNTTKEQATQQPTQPTITLDVHLDGNDLVFSVDGIKYRYKMVHVCGGTYTMGRTPEEQGDTICEELAHSVTVGGFYIGQTEVPQSLWRVVMGSNPSYWKGDVLPVEQISYNEIQDFIGKLNRITKKTFRLPTREEWEFAARGGNSNHDYKYSGSDNINGVAWFRGNSDKKTHPVKQKQPNELGLYDMTGNVSEQCSNCPSDDDCSYRAICGGSFLDFSWDCRMWHRAYTSATGSVYYLGFRLAL